MQWAYRWLHHVKPQPVLRLVARPLIWSPLVVHRTASSGLPHPAPEHGTPAPGLELGDYRRSYELVLKVLTPQKLDQGGKRQPLAVPPLNQQGIYQLLQHVKEGVLPSRFATLEWPGSTDFWTDLLRKSLEHDALMPDVWSFAQWWVREQGVQWPAFYETILMHYMGNGRLDDAKKWHLKMRKSHAFYPDRNTFANIINSFSGDPRRDVQILLNSLYALTDHRDMYDLVVPFLYGRGMSVLAISWHTNFCRRKDYPQSRESQAFLIFLRAYFPSTYKLSLPNAFHQVDTEERKDAREDNLHVLKGQLGNERGGPPENKLGGDDDSPLDLEDESPRSPTSPEHAPTDTVNLRYGKIFGISQKDYNDSLGARWFASTWISLDTALNIIHGLGVEQIGPLSLQSIALRDTSWEGFGRRLDQLRALGIGVQECNYIILLKTFTRTKNQKHLTMLLESDMHPDGFEDLNLLNKLRQSCMEARDEEGAEFWEKSRDILSEKRVNYLVKMLYDENHQKAIDVLDDLAASNLRLSGQTIERLISQMLKNIPFTQEKAPPRSFFEFHIDFYMRLLKMAVPLPALAWTHLLFSIGRHGHLDLVENLALAITQHILSARRQSGPGFMAVSPDDIPPIAQAAVDLGQRRLRVPNDLPPGHPWHPLNRIFSARLQSSIIRWGISQSLSLRPKIFPMNAAFRTNGNPCEFWVARGVRLLRLLKDHGLAVIPHHAISKRIGLRMAELYGPEIRYNRPHRTARESNTLTMEEFVRLCDEAWGEKLMPPLDKLMEQLSRHVDKHTKGHEKYIERKGIVIRKIL